MMEQNVIPKTTSLVGPINLYNNEELTLWKNISATKFVSSARLGNYLNTNSSLPALLFYNSDLTQQYPMLDIGILPSGTSQKASIGFLKKENEEVVEYAKLELDENNNLVTDSVSTITKLTSGSTNFTKTTKVSEGVFLNILQQTDSVNNTSGVITNQDFISNIPKPQFDSANIEPLTVIIIVGVVGLLAGLGAGGIALCVLPFIKFKNNTTTKQNVLALNDYEQNDSTNSVTYNNSLFLSTEQLQFNGNQYSLNRNGIDYITFTENDFIFNPNALIGAGSDLLTIDDSGNLGIEVIVSGQIEVINHNIKFEGQNINSVSKTGSIIKVKLSKKMDIYYSKIKIRTSDCKSRGTIISNIVDETDEIQFEVPNENYVTINIFIQ